MGLFNKNKKISGSITASLIDDANNESRQKLAKASAGKKGHKHNKKAEKKKRDKEIKESPYKNVSNTVEASGRKKRVKAVDEPEPKKQKKKESVTSLFNSGNFEDTSDSMIDEIQSLVVTEDSDNSKNSKKKKKSAKEHNEEMKILNLFGVRNSLQEREEEEEEEEFLLDATPEPMEEESEPEPEPEYKPDLTGDNVIATLAHVTDYYNQFSADGDEKSSLGIYYESPEIRNVTLDDHELILPISRVYVDGVLQQWDDIFEVKLPADAKVEVETGVHLAIPEQFDLAVEIDDFNKEKFEVDLKTTSVTSKDAMAGIIIELIPHNGAYLSQFGKVIKCQLEAR